MLKCKSWYRKVNFYSYLHNYTNGIMVLREMRRKTKPWAKVALEFEGCWEIISFIIWSQHIICYDKITYLKNANCIIADDMTHKHIRLCAANLIGYKRWMEWNTLTTIILAFSLYKSWWITILYKMVYNSIIICT